MAHELMLEFSADLSIVFDMEQQDSQDGSESDADEEVIDIILPSKPFHQINVYSSLNLLSIHSNLELNIELIGITQPTPPPEYLG